MLKFHKGLHIVSIHHGEKANKCNQCELSFAWFALKHKVKPEEKCETGKHGRINIKATSAFPGLPSSLSMLLFCREG